MVTVPYSLIGTHGRTFRYTRSLAPNDASAGWTDAEEIGPRLRQTYAGLVCDRDDTLHAVFRLWRTDTTYFPAGHYACLQHDQTTRRPTLPAAPPRQICRMMGCGAW